MKKLSMLLLSGVVLALAGCGNQGGSSDQYNTDSGTTTSDPNYGRRSVTNDYQGNNALRPVRSDANDVYRTNNSGLIPNDQSQPLESERTNNVPEN